MALDRIRDARNRWIVPAAVVLFVVSSAAGVAVERIRGRIRKALGLCACCGEPDTRTKTDWCTHCGRCWK